MLVYKFLETELTSYINDNRLTQNQELIKIICKAFEAYDEYKKLVSGDDNLNRLSDINFRMVNETKFDVRKALSQNLVDVVKKS